MLVQHDSEKKTTIKTNISDYIINIYIIQLGDDGKPKLIIFYLKKLIQIKLNYNIYNKKLLAIIIVFK